MSIKKIFKKKIKNIGKQMGGEINIPLNTYKVSNNTNTYDIGFNINDLPNSNEQLNFNNDLISDDLIKPKNLNFENTFNFDKITKLEFDNGLDKIVDGSINTSPIDNTINSVKSKANKFLPNKDQRQILINFFKKYGLLIFFIIISVILLIFALINSKWFVSRRPLKDIKEYQSIINLSPVISCSPEKLGATEYGNLLNDTPKKLCNFYVASSNQTCCVGGKYGWVNIDACKYTIEAGARLLDFDIFNSSWGEDSEPIVALGDEKTQLLSTKNSIKFEEIAKMLSCAFSSNNVSNYTDPLFLNFNIKVNKNFYTLNKLAEILYKYLGPQLLSKKYSYQKSILGQLSLDILQSKVVIIADKDFEYSEFAELVNASSQTNFTRILNYTDGVKGSYDHDELINFNRRWLTVCKADNSEKNEDPFIGWVYGCQFVCMNYSTPEPFLPWNRVNNFMDEYINKFKYSSFSFKPWKLRWHPQTFKKPEPQKKALTFATMTAETPFYKASI